MKSSHSKKAHRAIALAVVGALSVVACGGDDDAADPADTSSAETSSTETSSSESSSGVTSSTEATASQESDDSADSSGSSEAIDVTASSDDGGSESAVGSTDPGTISFMNWFYEGTMKEAYDGYIASFQEANANFEGADVETHPFAEYNDVLNVRLSSGDAPDVAWILNGLAPSFTSSGRLVDLMPYIDEDPDFNLGDFDPQALAPWQDGEALYGLPFTNATNVVYYNEDLFTAAGVKTPKQLLEEGNWTWESLRQTAKELTAGTDDARFGYVFGNNIYTNTWRVLVDIYGPYGALPWSADGTVCEFDTPETVAATQLVWDMIFKDQTHPGPGVAFDFAAGDVGMAMQRQNFAPRLTEVEFGWDVVPAPSGPQGFVPSIAQNGIVAFAEGEHPDLGAEFVLWTLTPENAKLFGANTPPARKSLQNIETLAPTNTALTEEQLERAVIPSITAENTQLEFSHPGDYLRLEAEAQRVFDGEIWVGDADVPAALADVCATIDPLLGS